MEKESGRWGEDKKSWRREGQKEEGKKGKPNKVQTPRLKWNDGRGWIILPQYSALLMVNIYRNGIRYPGAHAAKKQNWPCPEAIFTQQLCSGM